MSSIIFISFDIRKDEYPSMSYTIAAMVATLRHEKHVVSHYSVDLQHSQEEKLSKQNILDNVSLKLQNNIEYFRKFKHIAISLTSWTTEYCHALLELLSDYQGKVILGGYEVTSRTEENLVTTFSRADYFIKGYAEKALKLILSENHTFDNKVISVPIENSDLVSPYLTNILPLSTKKLHWETKRGCKFKCGFCEWGNATIKVIDIDQTRLIKEINLFRENCIDEMNILDGTFNIGKFYLGLFEQLISIEDLKITCQARFENLVTPDGKKFLELCRTAGKRVHLEFGLQTIHESEMMTIGRRNDLQKISQALQLLKQYDVDYEVSIIYAIPGQTIESFIDTIEFLITNGCRNIKAYPLSIPKNSVMESKKEEMVVMEGKNRYNVASVIGSYSFSTEQRADMDRIVERLNKGELFQEIDKLPNDYSPEEQYITHKLSDYQWEIKGVKHSGSNTKLLYRFYDDYLSPTLSDIGKVDVMQAMLIKGKWMDKFDPKNGLQIVNDFLCCKDFLELQKWEYPAIDLATADELSIKLRKNNENLTPQRYFCKVRISKSGNICVQRSTFLKRRIGTTISSKALTLN